MKAMKENPVPDRALEKAFRAFSRQTDSQVCLLKDTMLRLSDLMCEEFSSVRDEIQGEVTR
jgi:hypothetical protein